MLPERFSTLKHMATSPAHYRAARDAQSDTSISRRIGSVTHAMLFDEPFAVYEGRRAGKDWERFESEHSDRPIANPTEAAQSRAMVASIRSDRNAAELLFAPGTIHERRIDWSWGGRQFRSTPDAMAPGRIVDLKTTRCADPARFRWDVARFHYHAQLALYQQAAATIGLHADDLYIVAVESKPPHCVTTMRLTASTVSLGMSACLAWMERLKWCEENDSWPGYSQAIVDLQLDRSESPDRPMDEGDAEDL